MCVCGPKRRAGGSLATTMATVTSWLVLLLALSEIKFTSLSFLCTRGYYLICPAGRKWATATAIALAIAMAMALTWPGHEGSWNAKVQFSAPNVSAFQHFIMGHLMRCHGKSLDPNVAQSGCRARSYWPKTLGLPNIEWKCNIFADIKVAAVICKNQEGHILAGQRRLSASVCRWRKNRNRVLGHVESANPNAANCGLTGVSICSCEAI